MRIRQRIHLMTLSAALLLWMAPAVGQPVLSFSPSGGVVGGTAVMSLHIEGADEPYSGVNVKFRLPAGVSVLDVERGPLLNSSFVLESNAYQANGAAAYSAVAYSVTETIPLEDGDLLTFTLDIVDNAMTVGLGEGSMVEREIVFLDSGIAPFTAEFSIEHTTVNGSLVISQSPLPRLAVAPTSRTVVASAGTTTFTVSNVGIDTLDWMAAVTGGTDWLSIQSGSTGTNGGVITAAFARNPNPQSRTGMILIDAGDVPGSPIMVNVTQQADATPIIMVSEAVVTVPSASGIRDIGIGNTGNGTLNWTARVVQGNDWLEVASGAQGSGSGVITLGFARNVSEVLRVGVVEVSDPNAENSPVDIAVTQEAPPVLSVTPLERNVEAAAATAEFVVSNAGNGTFAWMAEVISGSSWLSITDGASGEGGGVIEVSAASTTDRQERTGVIRVMSPGVVGSPVDVTVRQAGSDAPILVVTPNGGEQWKRGESFTIEWSTAEQSKATEAVTIVLNKGGNFHQMITQSTGNDGEHRWTIPATMEPARDYRIQIIDVADSTVQDESDGDFSISCPPDAPENLWASDGETERVALTWNRVESATQYRIYRNAENDTETAQLIGTSTETSFLDFDASAPKRRPLSCPGSGEIAKFYYWVKAVNACDASDFSEPDDGHVGETPPAGLGEVFARVLPELLIREGVVGAEPDSVLSVRLRAEDAIDGASVWGVVTFGETESEAVEWIPISENDGWAVFWPESNWDEGTLITMTAGALTAAGKTVGPVSYQFEVIDSSGEVKGLPVAQPSFDGYAHALAADSEEGPSIVTMTTAAAGTLPALTGGAGPAYRVEPVYPFPTPQRVWIPVPGDTSAADLIPWYYHGGADRPGWYPAGTVAGFLVDGSALTLDIGGETYLGVLVHHPGVVQLAPPPVPNEAREASAVPLRDLSDFLPLALAALALLAMGNARSARCGTER